MLTEAVVRGLYGQGEEAVVTAILSLQERVTALETMLRNNGRNSTKPLSSDGLAKLRVSPTRRERRAAGRKCGGQEGNP